MSNQNLVYNQVYTTQVPYRVQQLPSIHDRPQNGDPRPLVIKGQYVDFDWVLVALTLIIIFVFLGWLAYTLTNQPPAPPPAAAQLCPAGQCATNIYNGVKTCPATNTDIVIYDPTYQVCNSATVCTSTTTPYAVQNDGSISLDGTCQSDTNCRCVARPQCGQYVLSAFETKNGNPFTTVNGQRLVLDQISSYNNGNDISTIPPIQFDDPLSTFCAIPNSWVERMGGVCERGTLAYLASDINNFSLEQANNTPLACMQGLACPQADQTEVWNPNVNRIACLNLCPSGQKPVWSDTSNQLECQSV